MFSFAKSRLSGKTLFFIFIACFLFSFLYATIINVPADQPTIQAGLNAATEGDTVLVAAGTYYENITWPATNGIKLIGSGEEDCIIDGNQQASVIRLTSSNIDPTTLITGFTIQNGYAQGSYPNYSGGGISCSESSPTLTNVTISGNSAEYGGGMCCDWNSSPTLENVTITNNSASGGQWDGMGGGMYCYRYSSPTLSNVTISNNSASYGGGMFCDYSSNPSLENVTITNNSASYGGGMSCYYSSNPTLVDVTIIGNSASVSGGGIDCFDSSPILSNVTISNNSASDRGGGMWCGYSSPTLVDVTITGNSASSLDGGGIYCLYSSPTLENVTITGNSATNYGGGMYCMGMDSSSTLTNVTISGNSAGYGGGMFCWESSPSLVNMTITDNSANYGGGIYCYNYSSPSLDNVTISGNSASLFGGGIYCLYYSSPSLENVTISDNSADYEGGGICCDTYSSPSLENVTITGNTASDQGGGICCWNNSSPSLVNMTITDNSANYGGGIYCYGSSSPSLVNCILWNNSPQEIYFREDLDPNSITIAYSDIQGGEAGIITNNNGTVNWLEGNINSNPLFVDAANGDYHLSWANFPIPDATMSPCIDTGDPSSPLDPDGTVVDMGAFYFDQSGIIYPPISEFTSDITQGYSPLTVNFTDLSTPGSAPIDEWYWDFGNGNNSTLQNPVNEYFNRGSYMVSLSVTDVNDSTDTETKVDYITVLNSAPVVQNPIADFSFDEDTVDSSIDLNNVFDDADLPYGDILSFSYSGNTFINVSIVSGIVTLTPDPDWFGFEDITFTTMDDSLASISDEVRITIDPVNDAPVINSYDPSYSPVTINETETQLFWISASDIDGDILTFQWYVDDVPQTGQTDSTYTHTTDYTSSGTYMIKCIVDDGIAARTVGFSRVSASDKINQFSLDSESRATDYQEWQLIVNDVDQNIVVNDIQPPPGSITIDEMDTINFFIDAYDPDGNPLDYSWELDGVGVSVDSTYLFTTDYTSAGIYSFTLFVTDNFSDNSIYYEWNITVNDVDQEIVVNNIQPPPGTVTIDEMDTINFLIDAYDPDGNPLEYSWKLDGVEESTTSTYDFITDYNSAGNYLVTLDVTDNFTDNSLYYEWSVTVNDVDQEIVVNDIQPPPGPVTIDETETINFFIYAYDPDGNPLEYSWKLDGVEVSTTSTYDFITDYTSAGVYSVTLYVTDNFSDRSDNTRNELNYSWAVTVNDVDQEIVVNDIQPPPGPVTIDETETINFFIDAYDPDGNPLEYIWKLDGVEVSTTSTYDFTTDYTSAGIYLVTLDVTDNFGTRSVSRNTLNYSWDVTVNDVDQPIVVNELIPPEGDITIDEGDVINFSIDAYDPDGNPLEYSWQVDGVEVSVVSTFDFTTDYTSAGLYLVTLDVTDNFTDNSLYFEWNVTVNDVDQAIIVNDIQPAPGPVTIDEMDTIDFFFSGYDPDGNPLDYSWELDGVEVSTDSTYTFETDYTSAGEYIVTLEVTDNFGTRRISSISRNTLNYSWDVTVNDIDQLIVVNELIPPEGDITIDEGDVINFSIDAYDPDGNDLEYSWQVDGVHVSIESSFDFITDENSAGEYEVTLFVTDNFGTRDELNFLWNVTVNDVSGSGEVLMPVITKLFQNHPNPFNPITNIQFDIKENETGVLLIYNIKGQLIESHQFEAGQHNFQWDVKNCSSGVYLYKLQTESFIETRKMILLK